MSFCTAGTADDMELVPMDGHWVQVALCVTAQIGLKQQHKHCTDLKCSLPVYHATVSHVNKVSDFSVISQLLINAPRALLCPCIDWMSLQLAIDVSWFVGAA